jgi:hypothetical protein
MAKAYSVLNNDAKALIDRGVVQEQLGAREAAKAAMVMSAPGSSFVITNGAVLTTQSGPADTKLSNGGTGLGGRSLGLLEAIVYFPWTLIPIFLIICQLVKK